VSDPNNFERLTNMNNNTLIVPSSICTAFDNHKVIGSKVTHRVDFFRILMTAVEAHDFSLDRVPGQAFLPLPDALPFVSSGVGKHVDDPEAYTLCSYRGRVSAFLRRRFASAPTECNAVVYTRDAYLNDPDITQEERRRINELYDGATHILVAVLVGSGPSQLNPYRFVANLAGGNHEAQIWTADEIRTRAKEILAYDNEWVTVTD